MLSALERRSSRPLVVNPLTAFLFAGLSVLALSLACGGGSGDLKAPPVISGTADEATIV